MKLYDTERWMLANALRIAIAEWKNLALEAENEQIQKMFNDQIGVASVLADRVEAAGGIEFTGELND
tara:strand:+ start:320 stop:520 length:201 start_codon:yes stop_codon:yes gene_type:complete